jgi:segregation and condensation protein B
MSSRKRKKPAEKPAAVEVAEATPHSDARDANGENDTPSESDGDDTGRAQEHNVEVETAPLVSEITELRPREAEDVATETDLLESDASEEVSQAVPQGAPKTREHLKRVIESLIFVSDQVISPLQIGRIVKAKQPEVRELVAELSDEYEGRGIELIEVSGGYQFRSAAASAPFVRDLVAQRPVRLTRAQLETLALIAYRQPITRPEIDDVRGVDSGSAIKVLLERDLVKILGRKDEAGRPLLYGTAPFFLEFFGMNSMQDLPTLREFTDLSAEHRELFQRKTGEIPDLSSEAALAEADQLSVNAEREADEEITREAEIESELAVAEHFADDADHALAGAETELTLSSRFDGETLQNHTSASTEHERAQFELDSDSETRDSSDVSESDTRSEGASDADAHADLNEVSAQSSTDEDDAHQRRAEHDSTSES